MPQGLGSAAKRPPLLRHGGLTTPSMFRSGSIYFVRNYRMVTRRAQQAKRALMRYSPEEARSRGRTTQTKQSPSPPPARTRSIYYPLLVHANICAACFALFLVRFPYATFLLGGAATRKTPGGFSGRPRREMKRFTPYAVVYPTS